MSMSGKDWIVALALVCALTMGLLMAVMGEGGVKALGFLLIAALASAIWGSMNAAGGPCGARSPDEEEAPAAQIRRDEVAESRSDFVGYCSICGRPCFTHECFRLDDQKGAVAHLSCIG